MFSIKQNQKTRIIYKDTNFFNLEEYIDYDRQFEKSFLDPMKGILEKIGWEYEKKSTIMDFFS